MVCYLEEALMNKRLFLIVTFTALISLAIWQKTKITIGLAKLFTTESFVNQYDVPKPSLWQPNGVRLYSENQDNNAQQAMYGKALHTDLHGTDEVGSVFAPMIELAWHAEPNMFVAEGPVFDQQGNVYFSPVFPAEDVVLVSLEPEAGKRRWVIEGFGAGAGTPLVMTDPDSNQEIVVIGMYDRAVAVNTHGNVIWDVPTGLPEVTLENIHPNKHSFGINYHIQLDAFIAVMGDGHVYILDRKTGSQLLDAPFLLPGAIMAINDFTLPKNVSALANADIAHMYKPGFTLAGRSPVEAVLHAAAGELQQVSNFFSIDSNSGRIWLASTLPDEEDGKKDGWSESAALFGLDVTKQGEYLSLQISTVTKVPGGTASTPAVSMDGKRIYVADAFDSIYAIDANSGEQIWKFIVGDKVTGSLDIAVDNGELYANTRNDILQVIDKGDHAVLGWKADLNMYDAGFLQQNFKTLGAEVGANGIAFVGSAGVIAGKVKFPAKSGVGVIDRATGKVRYFADGAEDSVSSTVSDADGNIYVGNSPLRRVLGRAILGKDFSPQQVRGGVSKFKAIRLDVLVRDALQAVAMRLKNMNSVSAYPEQAFKAELYQIKALLEQANRAIPKSIEINARVDWQAIEKMISSLKVENNKAVIEHALSKITKLINQIESELYNI